ncbi:hypothetical protein O5D80_004622 [Batrachochytrium dendrobatidis]|nr:hypothetical protein O5D80_004622 [Batrachochytrium dendrobatidis]
MGNIIRLVSPITTMKKASVELEQYSFCHHSRLHCTLQSFCSVQCPDPILAQCYESTTVRIWKRCHAFVCFIRTCVRYFLMALISYEPELKSYTDNTSSHSSNLLRNDFHALTTSNLSIYINNSVYLDTDHVDISFVCYSS